MYLTKPTSKTGVSNKTNEILNRNDFSLFSMLYLPSQSKEYATFTRVGVQVNGSEGCLIQGRTTSLQGQKLVKKSPIYNVNRAYCLINESYFVSL